MNIIRYVFLRSIIIINLKQCFKAGGMFGVGEKEYMSPKI